MTARATVALMSRRGLASLFFCLFVFLLSTQQIFAVVSTMQIRRGESKLVAVIAETVTVIQQHDMMGRSDRVSLWH